MKRRVHYLYTEKLLDNGSWEIKSRVRCACHFDENHWVERLVTEKRAS